MQIYAEVAVLFGAKRRVSRRMGHRSCRRRAHRPPGLSSGAETAHGRLRELPSRDRGTTGTDTMRFDLLIKGGEVVDPGAGYRGKLDVAIKRNRIAAVDADIPAESAFRVVDA